MSNSYIKINSKKLDKLIKEFGKKYYVDIGVFGGTAEGSFSLASVAATQEFGSIAANIPARSFIREPLTTHTKQIQEKIIPITKNAIRKGDLKPVFEEIGFACENIIGQAFETSGFGKWPANTETTAKRKKSTAPLIDTGSLMQSITSRVGVNK